MSVVKNFNVKISVLKYFWKVFRVLFFNFFKLPIKSKLLPKKSTSDILVVLIDTLFYNKKCTHTDKKKKSL